MDELKVSVIKITANADRESVFVLTIPEQLRLDTQDRVKAYWNKIWRDAGREIPPGLMILGRGMSITSLTDDKLEDLGLARITEI